MEKGGSVNTNLRKVKVNKTILHRSNPTFRASILKKGLVPKGKSESWLSDTNINGKVIFATNTADVNKLFDSGYDDDIYEIDITALTNEWYLDPNFSWSDKYNHIITFEPIPISAIKLVYRGSGKSNDNYAQDTWKKNNH